jgi:voltage-gated potassium channel
MADSLRHDLRLVMTEERPCVQRVEHSQMDERSERIAKRFEVPLLIAAVLVIPVIIVEESKVGEPWDTAAFVLNYAIWTAFLVEALVMLRVVPNKRRWLADHPLEVIVVVLTPPFFISAIQPIRVLRLLRLLRLFRLGPLVRHLFTLQGLKYSALLALLTVLAAGAAFHQAENGKSYGDGIYWAAATMTTVGSNLNPVTTSGKIIAVVVMLVGIGFAALATGAIARIFLDYKHQTEGLVDVPNDERLLTEFREVASRMRELEVALEAKLSASNVLTASPSDRSVDRPASGQRDHL